MPKWQHFMAFRQNAKEGKSVGKTTQRIRPPSTILVLRAAVEAVGRQLAAEQRKTQRLEEQLATDRVTGISPRPLIEVALERAVSLARRHRRRLCLVVLDIDHFGRFNKRFGILVGDDVLRRLGALLKALRTEDEVGRWGGDECVLVLIETPLKGAVRVVERLREHNAEKLFVTDGKRNRIPVTASFGVAEFRRGDTAIALFEAADRALRQAKRWGRNRTAYVLSRKPWRVRLAQPRTRAGTNQAKK